MPTTSIQQQEMNTLIQSSLDEMMAIRHHLHQHPELKYEEINTAQLIADTLIKHGYQPKQGVGKTGVVAVLDSGKPGKTVALRADMDALPLQEQTKLSYASTIPGIMHACGHDGHCATLLLVAKILQQCTSQFSGKIKFIFQPAEEGGMGAAAMVKDGVLNNPNVDAIFGYHNSPGLSLGTIAVRNDCIFSGAIWFHITIEGVGGNTANPDKAINPILIGSHIVQSLQSITSAMTSPQETCTLSVTEFHAGATSNVIPMTAKLTGSIRIMSDNTADFIQQKIQDIAEAATTIYGGNVNVTFPVIMPPTINEKQMTALVQKTALDLYGDDHLLLLSKPYMASEGFSYYLNKIPGCYFTVGNNDGIHKNPIHHPEFIFHDEVIPVAANMLANVAINYLNLST